MVAIAFLIVGTAAPEWLHADYVGVSGLWLAAGLTLVTGFDYLLVGLRHSTSPAPEVGHAGTRQGMPVGKTARSARGP
jgi:hypothetical protein